MTLGHASSRAQQQWLPNLRSRPGNNFGCAALFGGEFCGVHASDKWRSHETHQSLSASIMAVGGATAGDKSAGGIRAELCRSIARALKNRLSLSLNREAQSWMLRCAIYAAAANLSVMGKAPDSTISIDDLPPPDTKRWTVQRKAEVVTAVRNGRVSLDEACQRYMLSTEEFLTWQRLVDMHGIAGLRTTHGQRYRGLKRTS
jgi:hypothetical protein